MELTPKSASHSVKEELKNVDEEWDKLYAKKLMQNIGNRDTLLSEIEAQDSMV